MFLRSYQRIQYSLLLATFVALTFTSTGCQQQVTQTPDTRAADETAIRAADGDMAKAVAALDPVKAASFYPDDVVGMSPDAPTIQGKENMQKYFETFMAGKPEMSWKTVKVEVARSGDLAYSWGTGKIDTRDKKGKVTETTINPTSAVEVTPRLSWACFKAAEPSGQESRLLFPSRRCRG